VVSGTTNTSGSTRTGLNAGTYQVTFLPVAGYTAPAATSVVVTAGATNVFTATYEAMATGSLTVTLEPSSAVAEGRWSVDGGGTWRTSGSTLSGMSNGTYTLTFKDVASHTTPADQSVTISGGAVSRTGTYVAQVGDLTVNLSPAAAVANGAGWSVDGGATWHDSGATAYNLLAGRQYYTFRAATGYTEPSTSYTTVIAGSNIVRSYSYTALPGSITVNLTPAEAVAAGALWSLDGGTNWNESGATVQDLSVKTYTIEFSPADGWTAPAATNYALSAGEAAVLGAAYDEIEPVGADCIKSQGFDDLDVHPWGWGVIYLNNSAVATGTAEGSGAAVATNKVLSGENAVRLWGATNGAVNPTVVFDNVDISGYTNVTLTIPFAAHGPDSGDDLHVAVSYDGGTTWTPSAFGTQIADGYGNLSMDYGVYIDAERQPQGTPYVLAVADSRTQIQVRVTFFNATGSPNAGDYYYLDEVQLQGDEGTAPVVSSALSVTLAPAAAVSAGAQWRVDGGAWRASGATATGLTAGAHTVSFSAVSGWTAPGDVATATTNGTTNVFTATYIEESSGPVTIFEDDFEDGDLVGWTQDGAGNWANSTDAPITGSRSLKHNLSGVAATNYIYAQPSYNLSADTTTWRFKLKNGNWDPSSANRFHVFLAASAADFTGSAVDGYAVGINLTGTDDLLKLCRVTDGALDSVVLASAVDWDALTTVAVEVTRTAAGLWELKTSTAGVFSGMTSAGTASDTTYAGTSYFGLYFLCTSTRAGQVWLDDVLIHQGELTGATDSDGDGMPDDYENTYFGGATSGDPAADDDDDGMSNLAEYVAGTHPGQGTSVLAFDSLATNQTATANLIFRWPSVSGRVYAIWRATNAMGPYTQHIGGITADTPTNTVTNAAPTGLGTYFFGLKVEME
jgi:hypothetical protein